jgi:hypothetical protein
MYKQGSENELERGSGRVCVCVCVCVRGECEERKIGNLRF